MLLLLCVISVVLGFTAGRPAVSRPKESSIISSLADIYRNDLTRTIGELKTEQQLMIDARMNETTQQIKTGLQRTTEHIAELQNQTTNEMKVGLRQILQVMEGLQEQLTEVHQQGTATREQLTEVQRQLTTLHLPEHCPAGWSRFGQACYLISLQHSPWYSAGSICAALHPTARLASMHDAATTEHIGPLMKANNAEHVYIGLYRSDGGANWRWKDGTPLDYISWKSGEPNNSDGNENCVFMYQNGEWNDYKCSARIRLLCQITLD